MFCIVLGAFVWVCLLVFSDTLCVVQCESSSRLAVSDLIENLLKTAKAGKTGSCLIEITVEMSFIISCYTVYHK